MLSNGPHACIQFMNRVILITGRLGWVIVYLYQIGLSNGPHVLGNGLDVLGNGPQVLGNGNGLRVLGNWPHMLGIGPHVLGIMLHSGLCHIRVYVVRDYDAFVISCSGLCRIRDYVIFGLMSFEIMSFGLMSFGFMSFGIMSFGIMSVYNLPTSSYHKIHVSFMLYNVQDTADCSSLLCKILFYMILYNDDWDLGDFL